MGLTKQLCFAALCLVFAAGGVDARNVFVMPGSGGQTINVVGADPLGTPAAIPGPAGSFLALARPDGQRYYVLAGNPEPSLLILDSNFNTLSRRSLGEGIRTALITPDGRRLLVLGATLRVFDTETGNEIVPPSAPNIGANPIDMAVGHDSRRVFVLAESAQQGAVVAIDITSPALPLAGSLLLGGGVYTGIARGPNGYLYVSRTNQVAIIDPATLTQLEPALGANGLPGKLSFTPDGQRGVAVNRQTVTGASAFVFDLINRTTSTVPNVTEVLEELAIVGNNRAIASSNGRRLYDITLTPGSISQAAFVGLQPFSDVTGFAVSDQLPSARHLFVASAAFGSPGAVNRLDLANNIESGGVVLAAATGRVSFAGPVSTGPATTGLAYNNNQGVLPGANLIPLIARFLDAEGRPVAGAAVNWSTGIAEVILGTRGSTTNQEGFVQALVTAPATPGNYQVDAISGAAKVTFNFTVTTAGGGGGGGVTPGAGGGIFIDSGNGQLVPEQASPVEPLVVLVKNPDGTPAVGQQVTFELTQGNLTLFPPTDSGCSGNVCTTDKDGKARMSFTTSVIGGASFQQAIVTARLATGASVPFNIIIYLRTRRDGLPAGDIQIVLSKPVLGEVIRGKVGGKAEGAIQAGVYAGDGPDMGRPIPNVGIKISTGLDPADGPTVSCQEGALSDASGKVSCDVTFGGKLGEAEATITIGSNRMYRTVVRVDPGDPAQIRIVQGDKQSGNPGQKLPLPVFVEVADVAGNRLEGVPVTWEVVQPGTLTLSNARAVTASNGQASAEVTLGQAAGVVALRVKAGAATATLTFTVNVRIARLAKLSGDGQQAITGQPYAQPLVVQVLDEQGRGVPGVQVSFSVISGSALVTPATTTTGADGRASTSVVAGGQAGTIQIRAAGANLTETFTLTARLPGPVVNAADFRNAASNEPGITPGGLAIVRGTGIAPGVNEGTSLTFGRRPTELRGVEIRFGGIPAPILRITSQGGVEEVTLQVPFEVPVGTTTVSIRSSGGGTSTVPNVPVLPVHPGVFEDLIEGRRIAVVQRSDGSFVAPSNPALRGERITFFATGAGQTTPATGTNRIGVPGQSIVAPIIAGLNDAGVMVVAADAFAGEIGMYAITIEVPLDTAPGPAQNLGFAVQGPDGNWVYANGTVIPIR